jgi:pimeloyl-ACP methyl ester carboxylesterase
MKERAVLFGSRATLVGIITEAAAERHTQLHPGVLLLNAGLLHRIGPSRMYVCLARKLAAAGFTVLRLDFSGIGDSPARRDTVSLEEGALEETREAMDLMARTRGTERFLLIGLCSGADSSFQAAKADPRVAGVVLIDGFAYRTPSFWRRYYQERVLNVDKWKHLISMRLGIGRIEAEAGDDWAHDEREAYERTFPPIERTRADLEAMAARGVRVLVIYSAGQYLHYNYAEQFDEAFDGADFRGLVTSRFFPASNHTFTRHAHRDELVNTIADWAAGMVPGRPSEDASAEVALEHQTAR